MALTPAQIRKASMIVCIPDAGDQYDYTAASRGWASTLYETPVSLTVTPPDSDLLILAACMVKVSGTTWNHTVSLNENGTTRAEAVIRVANTNEMWPWGCVRKVTKWSSGNRTFGIQHKGDGKGKSGSILDRFILVTPVANYYNSEHHWNGNSTPQTTTSATYQTHNDSTFTPSQGSHLIIAHMLNYLTVLPGFGNASVEGKQAFTVSGENLLEHRRTPSVVNTHGVAMAFRHMSLAASSDTLRASFRKSSGFGGTAGVDESYSMALAMDTDGPVNILGDANIVGNTNIAP